MAKKPTPKKPTPKNLTKAQQAKIDALMKEAKQLYDAGEFKDAIEKLDQIIDLNPENDAAWNNRGSAKSALGDYHGAINDFDEAIRLNPESDRAWSNRGLAKNELGDHHGAIIDHDEAIRLNPNSDAVWNNRGVAKNSLGDFTGAVADLRHAMALNPNNEDIVKSLQSVLQEIEVQKLAEKNTSDYAQVSERMRNTAGNYQSTYIILYVVIAFLLLALGLFTYYILSFFYDELTDEKCGMECFITGLSFDTILPLISVMVALTLPLVWLIRMLVRIADDTRIMSEEYLRIHTIENRIELFFKGDDQKQKQRELHEIFINHMMTNSPVETLLKLRRRLTSSDMRHPVESMTDKFKDVLGNTKTPSNP